MWEDVATNSCVVDLCSWVGAWDDVGGWCGELVSTGMLLFVVGGGPILITSRGRGSGGAGDSLADAGSVSAQREVSVGSGTAEGGTTSICAAWRCPSLLF